MLSGAVYRHNKTIGLSFEEILVFLSIATTITAIRLERKSCRILNKITFKLIITF